MSTHASGVAHAQTRRPQHPVSRWANRHIKALFALPALGLTLVMMALPAVYALVFALTDARGSVRREFEWVGLENYVTALTQLPRFWPAVGRTMLFTCAAVAVQVVLGMAIAMLLRKPFRGQGIVRVVILLPLVATPVAVAMMWLLILEPSIGFANEFLGWFGIPDQGWLSDPRQALPTLIAIDVWQWTPMVALILLAGLASLPDEPQEAARVDGAGPWQRLWFVTLPMLRPAIVTALLLRSIDALKTFDLLYATKGRGGGSLNEAETLNILAYSLSFEYNDYGVGSAVIVLFFVLIVLVCLALWRIGRVKPE